MPAFAGMTESEGSGDRDGEVWAFEPHTATAALIAG